ncbi:MAG: DUF86 domain-containing protein, partial [Candidatus Omnitrophica bacterium]|nr:DUF86 domain-containing protein [Candidatus Omnitrophota bacterium]
DILRAINKIDKYAGNFTVLRLKKNPLIIDGIVKNLEIIGEAAKNIPVSVKEKYQEIEWKKITGLRDILVHEYFGIDMQIILDIIKNKLPDLKKKITHAIKTD